jgi:site-specific DNA-adenine methylase
MSYTGSKNNAGLWQKIISQITPHRRLVIPFGGHCAVTRRMLPCEETYLFDLNLDALKLWQGTERPGLRIIQANAFHSLPIFEQMGLLDDHDTFVYADPPYVISSRRSGKELYDHELTDNDHRKLCAILTRLKCRVAISGYHNDIYAQHLKNWRVLEIPTTTRGGCVTEVLWMNYEAPAVLHDDRWIDLGQGWRKRDTINRKIKRMKAKLRELPPLERRRLCSAVLAEFGEAEGSL